MTQSFDEIFQQLQPIYGSYMQRYPTSFDCVVNTPDQYYLNTLHIMPNKKPLYFGSVKVQKNYVSFHVMPVYVFPELLHNISADLKCRMQGKSCFNFKKADPELFVALSDLVKTGFSAYQESGYIK